VEAECGLSREKMHESRVAVFTVKVGDHGECAMSKLSACAARGGVVRQRWELLGTTADDGGQGERVQGQPAWRLRPSACEEDDVEEFGWDVADKLCILGMLRVAEWMSFGGFQRTNVSDARNDKGCGG
jgi:hypothetical protein